VLGRLATYDGGAFLKNGTIRQMNIGMHELYSPPGSKAAKDYCAAQPLLHA
jgi:hypothetical protein